MKLRDLPLGSLRTFAVVADCGGITSAAETLGVTHSAVSKQVKLLERWLGQTLFVLEGRRLILTPFGDILSRKLGSAFEDIAGACAYVQRQRERRTITVEAPATFAMYWLLPRVSAFRALEPQTDVWVSTRMTGQSPNFAGHDLVVMRGETAPTSTRLSERVFLFREDMAVLSSPKLLTRTPLAKPTDITSHALIESMTRPQDWQAWLKRANVNDAIVAGGHRFDHLFVAIQAVKDGAVFCLFRWRQHRSRCETVQRLARSDGQSVSRGRRPRRDVPVLGDEDKFMSLSSRRRPRPF
jgi:LysR family glycine cleavage system transcriptional activator